MRVSVVLVVFCTLVSSGLCSGKCTRRPEGATGPKLTGDNGFSITIGGNPEKYVPEEVYTVTLQGVKTQYSIQKFSGFALVVEPSDGRLSHDLGGVGTFQLFGDGLSKISEDCPNSITQTSSIPKREIQVLWTAPKAGAGCLKFKSMVVEHRDVWYMDDGQLTKEICEERTESQDNQPEILATCCACDEAKYEVTFEGLWSRNTHPKDFPTNEWLTHFSDIIGASHSADYRVWDYGGIASDGLKQVAEWGSTRKLESELKSESKHIRTIIKARGLWYPNVNGKTFAVFRVDRQKHLMSLVSMLGPSPDWIVGVSALELCLANCSWTEKKVLNLYPWDAGTDSGVTYMSPNAPTTPREKIREIKPNWPNSKEAPFFDPSGEPMRPVARLTIQRQRVYQKSCSDVFNPTNLFLEPTETEACNQPACEATEWSQFSPCSVTCGKGLRMRKRFYRNPDQASAMGCDCQLQNREMCLAEKPHCESGSFFVLPDNDGSELCDMTEWSQWSLCSATCGKSFSTRYRRYYNKMGRKKCQHNVMEKKICMADIPECENTEEIRPECAVTPWTHWSPCTVTCGTGMTVRIRTYLVAGAEQNSECNLPLHQNKKCQVDSCDLNMEEAKAACMQPKEEGPCRGNFFRWYYNAQKGMCLQFIYGGCRGNRNNFLNYEDCDQTCGKIGEQINLESGILPGREPEDDQITRTKAKVRGRNRNRGPKVDCVATEWSEWSQCSVTCGRGHIERHRMIKVQSENGGKRCPKKLRKKRRCRAPPCVIDCEMSSWSPWNDCSKTCGRDGIQQRMREVLRQPKNGGEPCGTPLERRYCINLPDCPSSHYQ